MFWRIVARRSFSTTLALRPQTDPCKIGNREVVGFGMNGQSYYVDTPIFPYPAIRFKEITPVYKALKEKEKGDWRSLTFEDKKTLYRISFCQTFAEMTAPMGRWKTILGGVLLVLSAWGMLQTFISSRCNVPRPDSFSEGSRVAQLRRMIALKINPVDGLTSKWDYENERWK